MFRLAAGLIGIVLAGFLSTSTAQEATGAPPPAAQVRIADAAWLTGDWIGEGFGGVLEESWSAPAGAQMVGHFRMVQDGVPQFYEFLAIEEYEGGLRYRVKHFNPDLTGWEEKNEAHTFAFVSAMPDELHFDGLILRRTGPEASDHILTMRRGDGPPETVTLHYRRRAD